MLTALCQLDAGPDNDGDGVPDALEFNGGCLTLQAVATKLLGSTFYAYDLMIDAARADFVAPGLPDFQLVNPSIGYVAANSLSVTLPVTTTIHHKSPDPWNCYLITPYLWLFSESNLTSTSVKHALSPTGAGVPPEVSPLVWSNPVAYGDHLEKDLYKASASQTVSQTSPFAVGLNQQYQANFNSVYGLPAYECVGIPPFPLFFPLIPACWTKTSNSDTSQPFDPLYFDILPNTLDEFITLVRRDENQYALGWDAAFSLLPDADGDGLNSSAFGGLDPNDNDWDADNDGLSDAAELAQRQAGVALELGLWDTDFDGLTDAQELTFGTDPGRADTDNDGLTDSEEVRHIRYASDGANVEPVDPLELVGGWQVVINSAVDPRRVWVSSDPRNPDGDNDGVSDLAEKQLAESADPDQRVDENGVPYHPNVVNVAPVAVFMASNAGGGFVSPGQTVAYTTTVVASAPLAPSVLNVTVPSAVGSLSDPILLDFDSATFSGTQTVAVSGGLTVPSSATEDVTVNAAVPPGWPPAKR